jgi:hypothetical protein
MSATKVLELCQNLNHGNKASSGDVLGVVFTKGLGETGTVVQFLSLIGRLAFVLSLRLVL